MSRTKITVQARKPKNVVERNIAMLGVLMSYLLAEPQVFDSLPTNFELVILPDDDPEICLYNLRLLDTFDSQGKPVVFARVKSSRTMDLEKARPSLYVPLAA